MEELQYKAEQFETYGQFKLACDYHIKKTAEDIVQVGYLLKYARDTGILEGSGYKTMADFARKEYGIDAPTASRFISINDRYSEGGNSLKIAAPFKDFKVSMLTEMLSLPEGIAEEMNPDMPRAEIREVKDALKEEEKTSDIEILIEAAGVKTEIAPAAEVLRQYFRDAREHFAAMFLLLKSGEDDQKSIMDILAAPGYAIIMGRVPGKGRMMISLKSSEDPAIINARTQEKESFSWDGLSGYIREAFGAEAFDEAMSAEELYEKLYGQLLESTEAADDKSGVKVTREAETDRQKSERSKKTQDIASGTKEQEKVADTDSVPVSKQSQSEEVIQTPKTLHEVPETLQEGFMNPPEGELGPEPAEESKESPQAADDEPPRAAARVDIIPEDNSAEQANMLVPKKANCAGTIPEGLTKDDQNTLRGYKAGIANKLNLMTEALKTNDFERMITLSQRLRQDVIMAADFYHERIGETED